MKNGKNIEKALELIERDHGGCDSNTCTISVALRNGYALVAIDSWIGSGAASEDFPSDLGLIFKQVQKQAEKMCKELPNIECGCGAILWLPEECGYWCDNCGKQIKQRA